MNRDDIVGSNPWLVSAGTGEKTGEKLVKENPSLSNSPTFSTPQRTGAPTRASGAASSTPSARQATFQGAPATPEMIGESPGRPNESVKISLPKSESVAQTAARALFESRHGTAMATDVKYASTDGSGERQASQQAAPIEFQQRSSVVTSVAQKIPVAAQTDARVSGALKQATGMQADYVDDNNNIDGASAKQSELAELMRVMREEQLRFMEQMRVREDNASASEAKTHELARQLEQQQRLLDEERAQLR